MNTKGAGHLHVRGGAHPRAYRHKPAPTEPEARPDTVEPYRGPATQEEWIAQLHDDPEFIQWRTEERGAELAMLTVRAYSHTSDTEEPTP